MNVLHDKTDRCLVVQYEAINPLYEMTQVITFIQFEICTVSLFTDVYELIMLKLLFCSYISGSEDGKIHVWNAESGMKVALLDGKHTGPITCLQFNPKFMTFASACSNMVSGGNGFD